MSNSTIASTSPSSSFSSSFISSSDTPSSSVAASSSAQASFSSAAESSVSSAVSSAISSSASVASASTTTVEPSSTNVVTSVVSASSQPASTQLITSVVTNTPSVSGESSLAPVTIVITTAYSPTATTGTSSTSSSKTSSASSTSSGATSLQNNNDGTKNSSGGLSAGGKTAVAVVVPVVVVALLVVAGLFFWRKRKQRQTEEEARRKEVEEYGFNPNNDPTLPVIAGGGSSEMAEDHSSGYRGWGNAGMSNRKASTTLSGGHTAGQLSDTGSNPGGVLHSPGSPPSDGNSGEGLVDDHHPGTFSSDDVAALGAAPVAGSHRNDIRRGASNASSSYSANHSDNSDVGIAQSYGSSPDMYSSPSYGYTQPGPYGDGTYGGGVDSGMPIVRDVSARRNTRIEAGGKYQQGNSGIAQNF